ncbi:MAG: Holliday junction resolvase RecU, partial [Bacilli bacterium]|nr:Holliday junction resolvase RecU [Bacilli bacterium]
YYKLNSIALITKRPTPINVVKVDYSKGSPKIVDAYFEKQSTTDYNGVYKGKYIDFEAKSTKNKTSFPLANIPLHQINHLKNVLKNDGIAFFLIKFVSLQEIYFVDAKYVISFYETSTRKSIPYKEIVRFGYRIVENFNPRIDFISIIDKHFIK